MRSRSRSRSSRRSTRRSTRQSRNRKSRGCGCSSGVFLRQAAGGQVGADFWKQGGGGLEGGCSFCPDTFGQAGGQRGGDPTGPTQIIIGPAPGATAPKDDDMKKMSSRLENVEKYLKRIVDNNPALVNPPAPAEPATATATSTETAAPLPAPLLGGARRRRARVRTQKRRSRSS